MLKNSPSTRTIPKIRLCASVSSEDTKSGRVTSDDSQLTVGNKTCNHFDDVFQPECSQEELCSKFLPDMISSLFNGHDSALLSIGAKSIGKEKRLYNDETSRFGIVQTAIEKIMATIDSVRNDQERFQVRISAILISQKDNSIVDILSLFNTGDPRRRTVRIVDDPKTGVCIENESEIRIETVDQALFYLNAVADHRLVQDEQTHRTSHVLITISLYSYRMHDHQLQGGGRKMCFLDMGIGDRNSSGGGLSMPTLGMILLSILQRNKHIPSRESNVTQLLRCALATSRFDVFLFSFGNKDDDNENIVQLASKISRIRKIVKKPGGSSTTSDKRRELESGSGLSEAETVIFLGTQADFPSPVRSLHRTTRNIHDFPNDHKTSPTHNCDTNCTPSIPPMLKGHTPFLSASLRLYDELCSPPPGPSPHAFGGNTNERRDDFGITIANVAPAKQKYNLDDGKRHQIMQWMEEAEPPPVLFQTIEDREDARDCVILSHPLEDIIEQEEESLRTSASRSTKKDHPLRILSKQDLDRVEIITQTESADGEEADLPQAMAASVSSIKSHDLLAKLEAMRNTASASASATTCQSEMDLYRRASQLEEYAMQRVKELEDEKKQKKKKNKFALCCQQSMVSSSSTVVDWSAIERRKEEEKEALEAEKRKEELRERREKLKMEELELRKERSLIDKQLDDKRSFTSTLARQFHHFSLSPSRASARSVHQPISDSLPTTPSMIHKKFSPSSPSKTPTTSVSNSTSLARHTPLTSSLRKTSMDGTIPRRRESKTRSDRREKKGRDEVTMRSPYALMTSPKTYFGPGTSSSDRGSDDALIHDDINDKKRTKRQSYSASSGYESATGDYHVYSKPSIFEKRLSEEKIGLARQAESIRRRQRQLKKELDEAKKMIGQVDDARSLGSENKSNGLSRATLIDTLIQENKIIEKRIVACRNHSMLVTTFM